MILFGDATESLDCMDIIIGTNMLEILEGADLHNLKTKHT